VLNIRSIGVGVLSGFGERKRCDQTFWVDGVGESLKQLERAQPPAEQLQPLSVGREDAQNGGPFLGDLAEQLESGAVLEPFRGHNDLVSVRAQQVEAIAFVRNTVDAVDLPERSGDRQVAGRILVDDEHTHAADVTGGGSFRVSGRSRFPYSGRIHSVVPRIRAFSLAHCSLDAACMGHIRDAAQSPEHPCELLEIGDRYGHQNVS
jgi:hypothetical protein